MTKGIDVSTLQGTVNWSRAKADGVQFAMIKATQGRGEGVMTKHLKQFKDPRFAKNINGATAAGIPCGVYHYFTATTRTQAAQEAEYFCRVIQPYKNKITLWAAVDVESKYIKGLDKSTLTELVRVFMDTVRRLGFKPMLYTNPDFLCYRFTPGAFEHTDIWLAHWGVSTPHAVRHLCIWQYGLTRVDGIAGGVDTNHGYFDIPAEPRKTYRVGDKYTLREGDVYTNGVKVPRVLWGKTYTVARVMEDRILLKEILSWVRL